jgi:hypothetical protein
MFPSWPSLVSLRAFLIGKPYSTRLCGKNSKSVRTTSRCHFPAETCNTIRLRMCPRSTRACALAACARETSRQLVRGAWPQSQLVPGVRNTAGRTRHRKQPGEPCGAEGVRARCRWDTPHARRPARGRRFVPALGRPQGLKQRRLRSTQAYVFLVRVNGPSERTRRRDSTASYRRLYDFSSMDNPPAIRLQMRESQQCPPH